MSTRPAEEPNSQGQTTIIVDNDMAQGPADTMVETQTISLSEYIEKEIANDQKIENDHQTVLVVANYLDKNPEIAQYYEYLVDWRPTSDESSHNFHAKFRLKAQYRSESSGARYVQGSSSTAYAAGGVQQYRTSGSYQAAGASYGGYTYEKENLGPIGEKYYSEPVEYEYVQAQRNSSPIRQQVSQRRVEILQPKVQVDIRNTQSYSMYEKHREQREQRETAEYQKIQNEHGKCCEIARMSAGIREKIIATYRAEIESHKYQSGDFSGLRSIVEDLRRRKEAMDISINSLQGDFESQVHNQESLITNMTQELELLKSQNADKSNEANEISEQTMTIKQEISTREGSIIEFTSEIRQFTASN